MKYIFVLLGMFLMARPITLSLRVINGQSVQKRLGLMFRPVSIKRKYIKFFWGKWNRNFFECEGKYEISLMVLFLLPFNLLMYILILTYLVLLVIASTTNNEILLMFVYWQYGLNVVIYMVLLGIVTTVSTYSSYIWKKPKVSAKKQKENIKNLNRILKDIEKQKWYYPLSEKLMNIASFSNDEKSEYWFEKSQIPSIKKLVIESSKNATFDLKYQLNEPTGFVVIDIKNNNIVFQGLLKGDV